MKTLLSCLAIAFALSVATAPAAFADNTSKSATKANCDKNKRGG